MIYVKFIVVTHYRLPLHIISMRFVTVDKSFEALVMRRLTHWNTLTRPFIYTSLQSNDTIALYSSVSTPLSSIFELTTLCMTIFVSRIIFVLMIIEMCKHLMYHGLIHFLCVTFSIASRFWWHYIHLWS